VAGNGASGDAFLPPSAATASHLAKVDRSAPGWSVRAHPNRQAPYSVHNPDSNVNPPRPTRCSLRVPTLDTRGELVAWDFICDKHRRGAGAGKPPVARTGSRGVQCLSVPSLWFLIPGDGSAWARTCQVPHRNSYVGDSQTCRWVACGPNRRGHEPADYPSGPPLKVWATKATVINQINQSRRSVKQRPNVAGRRRSKRLPDHFAAAPPSPAATLR